MLGQSKKLLKDEEDLANRGDFEVPELSNYIIEDNQYLRHTLRINKLVRHFDNHDPDTKHQNKTVKAVNQLSVSIFKN